MEVKLPSGTTLVGFNEVKVDIHEIADVMLQLKDARRRIEDLERLNNVLVDAAESNKMLRKNTLELKKQNAFCKTQSALLNGAARALWKSLNIELGELQDDGSRMLTISPKDGRADLKFCRVSVPLSAERASYIEPVFKADGTFLGYNDIYKAMRDEADKQKQYKDAFSTRVGDIGEEDL